MPHGNELLMKCVQVLLVPALVLALALALVLVRVLVLAQVQVQVQVQVLFLRGPAKGSRRKVPAGGRRKCLRTIGFIRFFVVLKPKISESNLFYKVFGGSETKNFRKTMGFINFSAAPNPKICPKTIGFIRFLVVLNPKM